MKDDWEQWPPIEGNPSNILPIVVIMLSVIALSVIIGYYLFFSA